MPDPTPISTVSASWANHGFLQGVATLSGKKSFAYGTTLPSADIIRRWVVALTANAGNTVAIKAHAKGALDEEVLFRIWLVYPFDPVLDGYTVTYIGTVSGRLSDTTRTATGIFTGSASYRLIDNWTIIDDASLTPPGMRIVGAGGDSADGTWAELQFDGLGAGYVVVEPQHNNLATDLVGLVKRYF